MRNLDKLNALLQQHGSALGLADHRRLVTPSFSNHDWLKKNLTKSPKTPAEIVTLLNMSQKELLKEAQTSTEAV